MKYKTKELLEMPSEKLLSICRGNCETSNCPFKPSLRKCREDGFCIKDTYNYTDSWIEEDETKIKKLEFYVDKLKNRVEDYKHFKKLIDNDLKKSNN